MKKFLFTSIVVLAITVNATSQTWIQKASMYDYGRRSTFGCSLNGKAYTGLGVIYNNSQVRDFWEYDTLSNSWTRKADYPGGGVYENTCFTINGKVYVCLGVNSTSICQNDLWEYTPITDMWVQKANFPGIPRYGARAFVIGDSAFIVAGSYGDGDNYLYDMYMYSPAKNTWCRKTDFAGGRRAFGTAFSINNQGYYGAGISSSLTPEKDFWKYDPMTDKWSSIPDFPGTPRNAPISFVIYNKAFVGFGGDPYTSIYYNDFGIYDPSDNSWYQFSVPSSVQERAGCIGFSIGDIGYIGVGLNSFGVLTDFWAFIPDFTKNTFTENKILNFRIYPNPTPNNIIIEVDYPQNTIFNIYNIDGQELLKSQILESKTLIDISTFTPGIYFLELIGDKINEVRKIIKE